MWKKLCCENSTENSNIFWDKIYFTNEQIKITIEHVRLVGFRTFT